MNSSREMGGRQTGDASGLQKMMSLDSVHWLQANVARAWEEHDPARVIPLLEKMLHVARGNHDALIYAHLELAEAYESLEDQGRARRHRKLALEHATQEQRQIDQAPPGDLPVENPWLDDHERLGDYEEYLGKNPQTLLLYSQWRQLDDELLGLLYWSNLRELSAAELHRLQQLEGLLLVDRK